MGVMRRWEEERAREREAPEKKRITVSALERAVEAMKGRDPLNDALVAAWEALKLQKSGGLIRGQPPENESIQGAPYPYAMPYPWVPLSIAYLENHGRTLGIKPDAPIQAISIDGIVVRFVDLKAFAKSIAHNEAEREKEAKTAVSLADLGITPRG